MSVKLDHSKKLLTKWDYVSLNWLGGKKRAALKEASAEIAARNKTVLGLRATINSLKLSPFECF